MAWVSAPMRAGSVLALARRFGLAAVALVAGVMIGMLVGGRGESPPNAQLVGPDAGEIRIAGDDAGPTDSQNGVGVGFAQSERGAVAAATNLVLTLEQAAAVDQQQAVLASETLAAAGSRETLAAEMELAWQSLHNGMSVNGPLAPSLFVRTIPVGHELVRYTPEQATVNVWTLSLVAADGLAEPLASWETATIEVIWEAGDWKVWSASSSPGPTPLWATRQATTVSEFLDSVNQLEGYRYVASTS